MKKCMGILLGAILILTLSAADKAPAKVQFKAALKGKKQIFSPGEKVPFLINCVLPAEYKLSAWSAFAYEKNVPKTFAPTLKLKVNGKDPRWRMIRFMKWQWVANAKEGTVDTANWPEGDYRITVNILVRRKDKSEDKTDKYYESSIDFTIEKP